jgi:hypothetical protein
VGPRAVLDAVVKSGTRGKETCDKEMMMMMMMIPKYRSGIRDILTPATQ